MNNNELCRCLLERARDHIIEWWRPEGELPPARSPQLIEDIDAFLASTAAQPVTCQIYGHVVGHCAECNVGEEAAQPVDAAAKDAPSEPLNCAVMPNGDCVMTLQEAYRSGSKMTQRFAEAIKNAPAFNMNGYDDDDVRRLHDWAVSVVHLTKQAAQPVKEAK